MKKATQETESGQQYAAALEAHYKTKDLSEALGLYRTIMDAQPESLEAEYSRSQIQNIARAVVPTDELFDVLLGLTLAHVAHGKLPRVASTLLAAHVAKSSNRAS
jgi:hypothetical protein